MIQSGAGATTGPQRHQPRSQEPTAGSSRPGVGSGQPGVGSGQPGTDRSVPGASRARRLFARLRPDAGMNTAEYAVGTLAAVAFAGLLLKVLTSNSVQAALSAVIARALK